MIRKLNSADKASILSLAKKSQMFEAEEIDYIGESFDNSQQSTLWFGAFEGESMIGVAYCEPMEMTNKTWNVLMLLVDPENHRKGIGKALMSLMEETLSEQSQRLLLVETSSQPDFEVARNFYRAIGYLEWGVIEHYYDQGDHKLTFTKAL